MDRTSGARLVAPGRLQIRDGGGWMTWFGMPFFLAGIFVVLAGVGIVPMSLRFRSSRGSLFRWWASCSWPSAVCWPSAEAGRRSIPGAASS
jgi:hypothetical protein